MTTAQPIQTTDEFVVYTESKSDHSRVYIIATAPDYFAAKRISYRTGAIVAYSDQFFSRFTVTSPNGMNGVLA